MEERQSVRCNKYLSEIGFCSRREADELVRSKRVTINDQVAELGALVSDGDVVKVDGDTLSAPKKAKFVYIAFNKPAGIVCTTDGKREKNNIVDFIGHDKRIFPIGRLDKDSEGLIFLTNDGDIVNKILRAENQHDKEYVVSVNKAIDAAFIEGMAGGVPILGTKTKKCEVEMLGRQQFRIVLTQGLNRQIRRMCQYFGYEVKSLTRIRIMNMKLDLPVGKWRNFKEHEIAELKALISGSSKIAGSPSAKSTGSSGRSSQNSATPKARPPKKGTTENKGSWVNPKSKSLRNSGRRK
ncbi:23S rRNA pseudouridine(2604) synthase RluF [Mangrovibacterium sp.]|uniref:23S rRNA pseudouridine(2604) synthase RluF n=1 Tax=Mangrovibacterium sp. TaxID=1961364 RepID=UPI0035622130